MVSYESSHPALILLEHDDLSLLLALGERITQNSTEGIVATWVIAPTCALADALASAFFFVSPEELADIYVCEYALMNTEGKIKKSAGFAADLFKA